MASTITSTIGKVEVAADQYAQAMAAYAKLDLGPRPIDEIRDPSSSWGIFGTPDEREQKRRLCRERILEAIIGQLDGVVWSLVSIQSPRAILTGRPRLKPSAFVYIETREIADCPIKPSSRSRRS